MFAKFHFNNRYNEVWKLFIKNLTFGKRDPAALIHSTVNQKYNTIIYWKAIYQEVVSLLLRGITNVLDVIHDHHHQKSHDKLL